jgi:hypothetical protein
VERVVAAARLLRSSTGGPMDRQTAAAARDAALDTIRRTMAELHPAPTDDHQVSERDDTALPGAACPTHARCEKNSRGMCLLVAALCDGESDLHVHGDRGGAGILRELSLSPYRFTRNIVSTPLPHRTISISLAHEPTQAQFIQCRSQWLRAHVRGAPSHWNCA